MRKILLILLLALLPGMAVAGSLNCTQPPLESVRLLCKANEIKARRVQTVIGGALAGALLGNLLAQQNGGNPKATNLHTELRTVLLRSSDDPKKREAAISQVADLGLLQAQDSAQGYTRVGDGLGAPVNGNGSFAPAANSFYSTRNEACAQLTRPGSYCS